MLRQLFVILSCSFSLRFLTALRSVLEAILEAKLVPGGAQTELRGDWEAPKSPQGGEEERQEGARIALEGPQEGYLDALGACFGRKLGEILVKIGVKIRKYGKRRMQQKP